MELYDFIGGCIAIEQAVASIYRTFMDLFPDERTFWEDLHTDEIDHSSWLSDIAVIESIDLLPSDDMVPSKDLVMETLAYINGRSAHIALNPVTLEEALKTALEIEKLMVETFTNELSANIFASDYASLSNKIIAAEKLHINKIEGMLLNKGLMQLS